MQHRSSCGIDGTVQFRNPNQPQSAHLERLNTCFGCLISIAPFILR